MGTRANRVWFGIAGLLAIPAVSLAAGGWHVLAGAPRNVGARINCFKGTYCWLGAGRSMFGSTDGGRSWHQQRIPAGDFPAGVSCTSASNCWATVNRTRSGTVIATVDGGRSWRAQSLGGRIGSLGGISCTVGTTCVAVGSGPQSGGFYSPLVFASTSDGGLTWSTKTVEVSGGGSQIVLAYMYAISCSDGQHCWASGQRSNCPRGRCIGNLDTVEATRDGGATWHLQRVPHTGDLFWDISCPNARDCWAAGRTGEGAGARGVLIATTDGGAHWHQQQAPPGSRSMEGISCTSAKDCTATGWNGSTGIIAKTIDGGRHWRLETPPPGTSNLGALSCSAHGYCLAAGYAGYGAAETGILAAN